MERLINDFSFGLFFWQAIILLVLIFLLRRFAWTPILDALDERENSIEGALNDAKKARDEMAQLNANNEKILKESKAERDAILKEARDSRDKIVTKAKDEASVKVAAMMTSAQATIKNEKMSAMVELKNNVAQLSIDMAEKVLKGELKDKSAQESLVNKLIDEVKLS